MLVHSENLEQDRSNRFWPLTILEIKTVTYIIPWMIQGTTALKRNPHRHQTERSFAADHEQALTSPKTTDTSDAMTNSCVMVTYSTGVGSSSHTNQ